MSNKTIEQGRYYYDCPVKALYMMKEFGLRFEYLGKDACPSNFDVSGRHTATLEDILRQMRLHIKSNLFIVKESEHILKLKFGDKGLVRGEYFGWFDDNSWRYCDPYDNKTGEVFEDEDTGEIIRRDNKAFFTPLQAE